MVQYVYERNNLRKFIIGGSTANDSEINEGWFLRLQYHHCNDDQLQRNLFDVKQEKLEKTVVVDKSHDARQLL